MCPLGGRWGRASPLKRGSGWRRLCRYIHWRISPLVAVARDVRKSARTTTQRLRSRCSYAPDASRAGRPAPQPQRCRAQRALQLAVRHPDRLAAHPGPVCRTMAAGRPRPLAARPPPVAVGYVLLLLFGNNGPIGGWLNRTLGIQLAFSTAGAALATAVMAFPLMVRSIRLALENVDPGLEAAARTLGAGPSTAF